MAWPALQCHGVSRGEGVTSVAALKPEIHLSQAYYISLNPIHTFRLFLLFDVLFYLTLVVKYFFVLNLPPLGLEGGLLSPAMTLKHCEGVAVLHGNEGRFKVMSRHVT